MDEKDRRIKEKENRGCWMDLLMTVPELVFVPIRLLFRGIGTLLRNWL